MKPALLLLVCIMVWMGNGVSMSSGQCPVGTHECVPFYQCVDGVINTSGVGVINIRYRPLSECETKTAVGEPGVCCKIPGGGVQATTSTTTGVPVSTCSAGQVCVIQEHCSNGGYVNTDGSGLIDIRARTICRVNSAQVLKGICCSVPAISIDTCPANSKCVQPSTCKGKALGVSYAFIPYSSSGDYPKCRLPGAQSNVGICCENTSTQTTPGPATTQGPTRLVAATRCGVRHSGLDTRTPGTLRKNDAQFGEFPWQAIIFFTNYTYKCGASLIEKNWLITGAHCVHGLRPDQLKIRLGEWQVDKDNDPLPSKDVDIAEIFVHPKFNSENLHNDIALIRLKTPVTLEYHINTICLPEPNRLLLPNTKCFASGWGKDSFKGQFQTILKKTEVPIVDHYRCQDLLRKTRLGTYFELDESFLCAGGEENKDVCKGDGGGPLVCQQGNSGHYFLAGITAWGIDCGQKDVPGVYADVQQFLNWLTPIIYSKGITNPYG